MSNDTNGTKNVDAMNKDAMNKDTKSINTVNTDTINTHIVNIDANDAQTLMTEGKVTEAQVHSLKEQDQEISHLLGQTVRKGRFLFFLIFAMGSLFSFFSLRFFVLNEPAPVPLLTYILFTSMALVSFIYGVRFVKNYSRARSGELAQQDVFKRKEALVVATAIQLLLIEFVCIIGLFLAIFTQKKEMIYPFYFVFLIGLYFSYPKADWYESVLKNKTR